MKYTWAVQRSTLEAIVARRLAHYRAVKATRPTSAAERRRFWPLTQLTSTAYFQSNRRLFRIYEPFSDSRVIKVAADVPVEWKLNRGLFARAVSPNLRALGWIPHSNCFLPRLGFWPNVPASFVVGLRRQISGLTGRRKISEFSWPNWEEVVRSSRFTKLIHEEEGRFEGLSEVFLTEYRNLFGDSGLPPTAQFRMVQILRTLFEQGKDEHL